MSDLPECEFSWEHRDPVVQGVRFHRRDPRGSRQAPLAPWQAASRAASPTAGTSTKSVSRRRLTTTMSVGNDDKSAKRDTTVRRGVSNAEPVSRACVARWLPCLPYSTCIELARWTTATFSLFYDGLLCPLLSVCSFRRFAAHDDRRMRRYCLASGKIYYVHTDFILFTLTSLTYILIQLKFN